MNLQQPESNLSDVEIEMDDEVEKHVPKFSKEEVDKLINLDDEDLIIEVILPQLIVFAVYIIQGGLHNIV